MRSMRDSARIGHRSRWYLPAMAFLLLSAPAAANGPSVVVFPLEADGAHEVLAATLTAELSRRLGEVEGLDVLSHEEIGELVALQHDKKLLMCENDEACMARIGQALDTERVLVGRVGHLGTTLVVTLKVTVAGGIAVDRGESVSADSEEDLLPLVGDAAIRLLGAEGNVKPRFRLSLGGKKKVAVLDLKAHGVDAGVAANLTELLSLELKHFEGLQVSSRAEIEAMLQYQTDKLMLECSSDTACLVEIGGMLGVHYLVSGAVGILGGRSYVIHLKLLDIRRGAVAQRISESYEGDEVELVRAIRVATRKLVGHPPEGEGSLSISTNVESTEVVLDGVAVPLKERRAPVSGLPVGKHRITVAAEGYLGQIKEGYVEPGGLSQIRFDLVPEPKAWYQKWWVWTIAGVAVAGATTAGVLLYPRKPGSGTVILGVE
jgi:TolB-like protein